MGRGSYLVIIGSILGALLVPKGVAIAPVNHYLGSGAWSISQHDCYAQASTEYRGPTAIAAVDSLFDTAVAGTLSVLYTPDNKVMWGSSFCCIFKVDRSTATLQLIDSVEKPLELRQDDTFRGIYSVLSREGIFYTTVAYTVQAYGDQNEGKSTSGIKWIGSFDFKPLSRPKERILALSMLYDGHIVFLTNLGGVGILLPSLLKLQALEYVVLPEIHVSVTNSLAVDEFGGIYVVSSQFMHRLWWDSDEEVLHFIHAGKLGDDRHAVPCGQKKTPSHTQEDGYSNDEPNAPVNLTGMRCEVWTTKYPVESTPITGRPTKEGSGTTPALLLDAETKKLYVMIADGMRKQNVLAIDAESGKIVATHRVDFGLKQEQESYTEQSLLVYGNKMLVTQNALTPSAQKINLLMDRLGMAGKVSHLDLPEAIKENVDLLPVVLGDNPLGYQQFVLDTSTDPPKLETTWTRNDIGCSNSIPTMSATTGVLYCVGRVPTLGISSLSPMGRAWTIDALNWNTGTTVFSVRTGNSLLYNSFYAATQIGPNEEIINGVIGGLVRARSSTSGDPVMSERNKGLFGGELLSSIQGIRQSSRLAAAAATSLLPYAVNINPLQRTETLGGDLINVLSDNLLNNNLIKLTANRPQTSQYAAGVISKARSLSEGGDFTAEELVLAME